MSRELAADDKLRAKHSKPEDKSLDRGSRSSAGPEAASLLSLQQKVGNSAVQRILAQRSAEEGFEVDETTTNRINQSRGGGQALDGGVAQQMGETLGYDFSGVRVHTSAEANDLSQSLQAKAFTTGQDIFFKEGTYNPGSSSGRELLAHELTHVVQQGTGQVPSAGGGGLTVNPPDDVYEQEADAVAQQTVSAAGPEGLQRQEISEEEELMMKRDDLAQREEMPEEELQMKRDDLAQREEMPEEEELQLKRDDIAQREEMPEEEELQMKRDDIAQRCDDNDEASV